MTSAVEPQPVLPDDVKPSNAHIALTVIEDPDGTEHQILRDNMPFGRVGSAEFGTYFIGYARTPVVTELMSSRMFLGNPVGNHDRILDFSTALTGALFFVPSADFLDDLPVLPADAATAVRPSWQQQPPPPTGCPPPPPMDPWASAASDGA